MVSEIKNLIAQTSIAVVLLSARLTSKARGWIAECFNSIPLEREGYGASGKQIVAALFSKNSHDDAWQDGGTGDNPESRRRAHGLFTAIHIPGAQRLGEPKYRNNLQDWIGSWIADSWTGIRSALKTSPSSSTARLRNATRFPSQQQKKPQTKI